MQNMESFILETPVLFIIFNRPDTTVKVLAEIRKVKPKRLYIAADGPRKDCANDKKLCQMTRNIIDNIDWECELHKDFSNINLGCQKRVQTAIDWIFENNEQAIILEDDCLPQASFFRFCQELLGKYEKDTRIMSISGSNYLSQLKRRNEDSYFFSYFPHIWGWATWKRAWHFFDLELSHWPEIKKHRWMKDLFGNGAVAKVWENIVNAASVNKEKNNAWSYYWKYACLCQSGLCIIPKFNLISNIGFGNNATHSLNSLSRISQLPTQEIEFPLIHPRFIIRDSKFENLSKNLWVTSLPKRINNKLKSLLLKQ